VIIFRKHRKMKTSFFYFRELLWEKKERYREINLEPLNFSLSSFFFTFFLNGLLKVFLCRPERKFYAKSDVEEENQECFEACMK